MRKVTIYIFACLLFATMAVAQATSSQSSQPPAATQSQQQQPAATQSGQKPSGVQGTTANPQPPAQQSADQDSAQPAQRPADDNAPATSTQRAASPSGGGVPWGWIIVGIVVVAVILALIGRGSDRVETVERTDLRDRDVVDRDRDVIVREPRDRRVG